MPEPTTQPHPVRTDDGHLLEGELVVASPERAGLVLCHPHPQYGGTMRSLVISALFGALPAAGVTCLRFNFRGVEHSEGRYDEGRGERRDVRAAVHALDAHLGAGTPLVLAGWSFGADVALSSPDPRLAGWLAIAPPLRFLADEATVGADERPKLVVLAEHDEFRPPAEVAAVASTWRDTDVQVVGASHFFVGRTERVVDAARGFVERVAGPAG